VKIQQKNSDKLFILFILLLAAALRLYHASAIPFTHDEFSALFRTEFDSFSSLIQGGVLTDTHPAGIQVFLFYWVKLFGAEAIVVKLPFIIMGIASIYLLWLIASSWFNTTVALLAALLLASLEYPIMHSQIARPYISGLFFSLLMVYYWSKYLFSTKNVFNKELVFYVLASALCAYNHHFSLLFAAMVGVSGLFFIQRNRIIAYALAGATIFVLYLPHLSIFFHQLGKGGVGGDDGWLGAPNADYLWQYIRYIFNFSTLLLGIILIIVLAGLRYTKGNIKKNRKYYYLSLTWFLIPFLIGYFYSVEVNPVLQYSVLIFSFPFLFFILFGHLPEINSKWKAIILVILLPILLYTLVVDREYYKLFYESRYEGMVLNTFEFQQRIEGEKFVSILDSEKKINDYYIARKAEGLSYLAMDSFENKSEFIRFLIANDYKHISFGANSLSTPVLPAIIYDHVPSLEKSVNYLQGSYYEFSKNGKEAIDLYRPLEFLNDFESEKDHWLFKDNAIILLDSLANNHAFKFHNGKEWGLSFIVDLDDLNIKENDFIDIRLDVINGNENDELLIVSELIDQYEKYDWRSSSSREYAKVDSSGSFRMYHSIKLSDLTIPASGTQLKVYCWNRAKTAILVDDFSIKVRIGNPIVYGLLQEFESD
jgi:uncharacterized membrane protein